MQSYGNLISMWSIMSTTMNVSYSLQVSLQNRGNVTQNRSKCMWRDKEIDVSFKGFSMFKLNGIKS